MNLAGSRLAATNDQVMKFASTPPVGRASGGRSLTTPLSCVAYPGGNWLGMPNFSVRITIWLPSLAAVRSPRDLTTL